MITKIELEGIPPFKEKAVLETDKRVNLLYGLNGTGKTTISNLLYSINIGEPSTGAQIEFDNGIDVAESYEILVYNPKFVQDSFYVSSEIKGIFSLSKDNTDAQLAIDEAKKEKNVFIEQRNAKISEKKLLEEEVKNAFTAIQNKVWEIKTKYAGTSSPFDYCLEGLKGEKIRLYNYIKDVQKSTDPPKRTIDEIKADIEELKREDTQLLESLQEIVIQTGKIETESIFLKVIVGNEDSTIASFIKDLNNSDWVRQGIVYINTEHVGENQKCPFCQQKTITEDFIREIVKYFGGAYEKDIALLSSLLEQYESERNKVLYYDTFENNLLQSLKTAYDSAYQSLMSIINGNIELIKRKIASPSTPISILSSDESVNKINKIIAEANKLIKDYNLRMEHRGKALKDLKTDFWNLMRWKYDAELLTYIQTKDEKNKKIDEINIIIHELDTKIQAKDNEIAENQEKTINIDDAIKNINNALSDMGISDFKISKHSESLYKLSREGQRDNVFRSLSEGEKMIISLLYFIECCKGRLTKESAEKKKIVVIDDPISSLSHIYVYNVGRLILQEFTDANPENKKVRNFEQVFLLTHSLYFFYEMAIIKRKGKEQDYNQKLFRIQKNQQGSQIKEMKYNEIQNDYQAYWMIIKENTAAPALIANCMRNIIEYFFAFTENIELNNVFQKEEMKSPRFQAFNRYINRESHSLGHNIFDIKEFNYNDFKDAFELVFRLTGYDKHYERMMNVT